MFVFLMALLYSCSERVSPVVSEVSLQGQKVKIDSANLYIGPKFLYGDVLYAWNMEFYGGKLTKTEWHKSERLLASGNGHNEFGYTIISRGGDGSLFVLDRSWVGTKFLSLVRIPHADSIAAIKDRTKWEKYNLKEMPLFGPNGSNFVVLSDTSILVTGAPYNELNHVFSIIDFKNQKVTPLDYWPDDVTKTDDIEKKVKRLILQSMILSNGKGRFLYQNGWGRIAFIFDIDGVKANVLSSLYSSTLTDTAPTEMLACCVDMDRIYMLLRDSDSEGKKLDEYKDRFVFGNTVEVFDWDGEKQQVIHLDQYGQNIMLSEDSKTLYLISEYSEDTLEPYIYSYDL